MEEVTGGALDGSTFSQVLFTDVPPAYPPNSGVTCRYTLTAALQPHPRDWVGVFRVGWNSTQHYHTFAWVEPCLDRIGPQPVGQTVVFQERHLPRDDGEFYQFCYVDSKGQVRGASTPFCFQSPTEQSSDNSLEGDMLIVTTQVQTEQMQKEKENLSKKVAELEEGNEVLRQELNGRLKEIHSLRIRIDQMSKSVDEHPIPIQRTDSTESPILSPVGHQSDLMSNFRPGQDELTSVQEKYGQAMQKIQQLKKQRSVLREEAEHQQADISQLNAKLLEAKQEAHQLQDDVQLLQVDLQSSQKQQEKLRAELQNQHDLQEALQTLQEENEDLRASLAASSTAMQSETLRGQLQEARTLLRTELQNGKVVRQRAEQAEKQLKELQAQLRESGDHGGQVKHEDPDAEIQKLHQRVEDQLAIARVAAAANVELSRDNQELKAEIERLQRELGTGQPDPYGPVLGHAGSLDHQLVFGAAHEPEDEVLQCKHCRELFPGISETELTQHEECHKVCPMCTLICDQMAQAEFEDHVYSHEM
ncbi:calcium-binding and coiled-coil domain-containing protein 2 isoform X2 [Denticeps clupeoides]|nr:calcium-binding and coiled-coil domain-containing protein 2 isoform X2 [Denticeps clupeoides]XP_028845952.1 calcium-binding and coiled-coil domain-containing protein 2 isoform X2 [Denticeps clupeoides]